MKERTGSIALIALALLGACASTGNLNTAASDEPTLSDDSKEVVLDEASPLEGCVDPPEDPGGLAFYFESGTIDLWATIDRQSLLTAVEQRSLSLDRVEPIAESVDQSAAVNLDRYPTRAPLDATEYEEFVVGVWRRSATDPHVGVAALIGLGPDETISFLGDCQQDVTKLFRTWMRTSADPEISTLTELSAFKELTMSKRLQQEVLDQWYGTTSATPLNSWNKARPIERVLDVDALPESVFAERYPVVLEVSLPAWWVESGVVLCPFSPGVAWGPECVGSVSSAEVLLHTYVGSDGIVELHFSDPEASTQSLALIGSVDGLARRGTSVVVKIVPEEMSYEAALEQGPRQLETEDGTLTVPVEPGLSDPARLIDAPKNGAGDD